MFTAQQNGHQAWQTLHSHFFGGDKVNTICSDILSTLKSLHYAGNDNFNFNKYCTAHVEQYNQHATLAEFSVAPHKDSMKIHYFKDGITDLSFNSIKSTIMVDHQKFQKFDTVIQLYVNFKCSQKPEASTHQAHNTSAIQGHGVVDKAMGDTVVADKVDPMPIHKSLFLKKRSII
jgi:hypothetical protein